MSSGKTKAWEILAHGENNGFHEQETVSEAAWTPPSCKRTRLGPREAVEDSGVDPANEPTEVTANPQLTRTLLNIAQQALDAIPAPQQRWGVGEPKRQPLHKKLSRNNLCIM